MLLKVLTELHVRGNLRVKLPKDEAAVKELVGRYDVQQQGKLDPEVTDKLPPTFVQDWSAYFLLSTSYFCTGLERLLSTSYFCTGLAVSYTHLTLPTTPYV